jgi:hypothetical protein
VSALGSWATSGSCASCRLAWTYVIVVKARLTEEIRVEAMRSVKVR